MAIDKKARKNIYSHVVDLTELKIKNTPRNLFREELEKIPYKGYEVETISDGRKIVITKPGGKFTFGTIKREDFMVWIYDPDQKTLWLISHKNIFEDLEETAKNNPEGAIAIIDALERVYNGEEPDDVLMKADLKNPIGESPEILLKAYKWIWGQEDVNYPDGKGRAMSWEGLSKNKNGEWEKTGRGILDLKNFLKNKFIKKS